MHMASKDACYLILVFYLSASDDFEEARYNGAEALSNPLYKASKEGDVASDGQSEI